MKINYKIIYMLIVFSLISCKKYLTEEKIKGDYHLVAIETYEDLSLNYQLENGNYIGVVNETVFMVGFNDNYIFVKQHPSNDRKVTNYYIVLVYKNKTLSPEVGVIGPLTLKQFDERRKELQISDTTFTIKKSGLY